MTTNVGLFTCAKCYFNDVVQQYGPAGGSGISVAQVDAEVGTKSFCDVRGIKIEHPMETSCLNYKATPFRINEPRLMEPRGPLQTYGLNAGGEYFPLIPWYRDSRPFVGKPTGCSRCQTKVDKGISIELKDSDSPLEFCCNKHYMYWWCSLNGSEVFRPDDF